MPMSLESIYYLLVVQKFYDIQYFYEGSVEYANKSGNLVFLTKYEENNMLCD